VVEEARRKEVMGVGAVHRVGKEVLYKILQRLGKSRR